MKKYLKLAGIVLIIALIVIQFIPIKKNTIKEAPSTDFMSMYNVSDSLKHILRVTCYDCHSNNTRYPWYSKIQPVGWYLQNHIKNAKEELNFSEFGSYSSRKQNTKIHGIINQVRDGDMPLASYKLIHKDARLSAKDKKKLIAFMETLESY